MFTSLTWGWRFFIIHEKLLISFFSCSPPSHLQSSLTLLTPFSDSHSPHPSFRLITSPYFVLSRLLHYFLHIFKPKMKNLVETFPFFTPLSLRLPPSTFFQLLSCVHISSQPLISPPLLSSPPDIDLSSSSSSCPSSSLSLSSFTRSGSVRSFLSLDSPRQPRLPFNPSSRAGSYVLSPSVPCVSSRWDLRVSVLLMGGRSTCCWIKQQKTRWCVL